MSLQHPTKYKFRHYGKNPDLEVGGDILLWASDERSNIFPSEPIVKGSALELEVMRSQLWTPNALADEGEVDILDVYFDAQAVRALLYFRLYNGSSIGETDTLTTIQAIGSGEEAAGGYGAITVTRGTDWSAPDHSTGTTTVAKTFNATATWSALNALVLATVATGTSGLHIAWVNLSTTRSLVDGDSLDVDLTATLE